MTAATRVEHTEDAGGRVHLTPQGQSGMRIACGFVHADFSNPTGLVHVSIARPSRYGLENAEAKNSNSLTRFPIRSNVTSRRGNHLATDVKRTGSIALCLVAKNVAQYRESN